MAKREEQWSIFGFNPHNTMVKADEDVGRVIPRMAFHRKDQPSFHDEK